MIPANADLPNPPSCIDQRDDSDRDTTPLARASMSLNASLTCGIATYTGDRAARHHLQVSIAPAFRGMGMCRALIGRRVSALAAVWRPGRTIGPIVAKGIECLNGRVGFAARVACALGSGMTMFGT